MAEWNSNQYIKFEAERTQPSYDLANRIQIANPKSIIDIGCGPGNSTAVLKDKFPYAHIIGADNSQNMLDAAKQKNTELDFILFDAEKDFSKLEQKFDVVFSNACIQWIPNHYALLKNMMELLNDNGILAIQTPMNYDEPIHKIISEVTSSSKWHSKFIEKRIFYNLYPSGYFDLLSEISSDFTIWETTYYHKMPSHQSIMEWYKGTGLRPYISVLSEIDAQEFLNDIYHKIVRNYPAQKNGEIIFRFPRFFFIAEK